MDISMLSLLNLLPLLLLGISGWTLFRLLHLPVAPLLGTITLIGALRVAGFSLPVSPDFLSPAIQLILGFSVGSRVNRETARQLKELIAPVLVIITWTLSVAFLFGTFLSIITKLDLFTAILSCSMGGLPEMTIIALSTDAEVAVVIIMQTFRMVSTIIVFPLVLRFLAKYDSRNNPAGANNGNTMLQEEEMLPGKNNNSFNVFMMRIGEIISNSKDTLVYYLKNKKLFVLSLGKILFPLIVAVGGGALFNFLGVPAGAMIGSMISVAAASLAGLDLKAPPAGVFSFLLVGVGIVVSDNISAGTLDLLISGELLFPILVSTFFILISSLVVAYTISRLIKWDFLTCFLAAAPSGFTVMTTLAISSGKDPFKVSMLHLCRLISLKTVIPLVFMFFV